MRTCRDMRSSSQSTPNFHPEFGYLCRSGGKRGGLRLAAALVTSAMVLAGSMVLFGLADRSADASDQVSAAATIDDGQGGEVAANSALAALQSGSALPATVDAEQRSPYAERGCDDLVSSFLDHGCRANAPRKRRAGRSGHRVATVVIGSVAAPAPGADDTAIQPTGLNAMASAASIPLPVARPTVIAATTVTAQKPKIMQSRDLNPSRKDAPADAYARADDNARDSNAPRLAGFPFLFGGGLFGLR
jgi:hypothetical protein